jgi:hypothetical protein
MALIQRRLAGLTSEGGELQVADRGGMAEASVGE